MKVELVLVNGIGRRIGESHHRALLTDEDIDRIRELHEQHGWGYRRLAVKFDISRSHVRYICLYRMRAQTPESVKTVRLSE